MLPSSQTVEPPTIPGRFTSSPLREIARRLNALPLNKERGVVRTEMAVSRRRAVLRQRQRPPSEMRDEGIKGLQGLTSKKTAHCHDSLTAYCLAVIQRREGSVPDEGPLEGPTAVPTPPREPETCYTGSVRRKKESSRHDG